MMALWLAIVGCASKQPVPVEPLPEWRTPEGRNAVRVDLASALLEANQPEQALEMVRLLREDGIDTPEVAYLHGTALRKQGMNEEAQRILEEVVRKMPKDPRPYRELGIIHADAGRLEAAVEAFERALQLDDTDADTWNNLGFVRMSLGQCDGAGEDLEHALALDGTDPVYRNNLGFSLACAGRDAPALAAFRTTGTEADARYNLGVAKENQGARDGALEQYRLALEADQAHVLAREALKRLEE